MFRRIPARPYETLPPPRSEPMLATIEESHMGAFVHHELNTSDPSAAKKAAKKPAKKKR